jgi:hypothetical protein
MDEPRQPSSRHAGPAVVLIGLLLLSVLYIGGLGPACLLCMSGRISEETLDRMYAHLIFLAERSETFRQILEAYLELWTG